MSIIFLKAIKFFETKNYDQAKIILLALLKKTPKNYEALHMLGIILGIEGKHQDALNYLKKAFRLNSNNFEINFNLGKALSETGNNKDAIIYYSKAIKLNGKN